LVQSANAVLVSGHPATIQQYKSLAAGIAQKKDGTVENFSVNPDFRLSIFPPRYGAGYAKLEGDLDALAMGIAFNASDWDQFGCYTTKVQVMQGNKQGEVLEFVKNKLVPAFEKVEKVIPRAELPEGVIRMLDSYVFTAVSKYKFKVFPSLRFGSNFRILYKQLEAGESPYVAGNHPDFRHLFVFESPDLQQTLAADQLANQKMQTLTAHILDEKERNLFIDAAARKGISRVTDTYKIFNGEVVGGAAYNRIDMPYDGIIRQNEFLNWVTDERCR
ncbi:MAG: acyl-CoA reductase, partial [archaeon]